MGQELGSESELERVMKENKWIVMNLNKVIFLLLIAFPRSQRPVGNAYEN
jgi:hypothetical protein